MPQLNYRTYFLDKDQAPIVILHGLLGSSINFSTVCKKLELPSIGIDLRNHGQSFHSPDMSYPTMAKDVADTMRHMNINKAYIVGHSMGGKVALCLAALFPELVKKLIVVDIAPINYPSHIDFLAKLLQSLQSINLQELTTKQQAVDILKHDFQPKIISFVLTNLIRNADNKYSWQINISYILDNLDKIVDYPDAYQGFKGPSYWIVGTKSDYLTPTIYEHVLKHYPSSQYMPLPTGHWVHVESEKQFVSLIRSIYLEG